MSTGERIRWTDADTAVLLAHRHLTAAEVAAMLGRSINAIRRRRSDMAGAAYIAAPPKRRGKPQNQCCCGRLKTAWAKRCRSCTSRARVDPETLADALRRDPRPDGDKVHARLTLLKALWRQAQKRKAA